MIATPIPAAGLRGLILFLLAADAVWARLPKRDIEQVLTLTAARPAPPVMDISESVERIGEGLFIADHIDHPVYRKTRARRLEVKEVELQELLQE